MPNTREADTLEKALRESLGNKGTRKLAASAVEIIRENQGSAGFPSLELLLLKCPEAVPVLLSSAHLTFSEMEAVKATKLAFKLFSRQNLLDKLKVKTDSKMLSSDHVPNNLPELGIALISLDNHFETLGEKQKAKARSILEDWCPDKRNLHFATMQLVSLRLSAVSSGSRLFSSAEKAKLRSSISTVSHIHDPEFEDWVRMATVLDEDASPSLLSEIILKGALPKSSIKRVMHHLVLVHPVVKKNPSLQALVARYAISTRSDLEALLEALPAEGKGIALESMGAEDFPFLLEVLEEKPEYTKYISRKFLLELLQSPSSRVRLGASLLLHRFQDEPTTSRGLRSQAGG